MTGLFEVHNKSVIIPDINLSLDSKKRSDFGFISHAHSDHTARHKKILCSDITAQLLNLRLKNTDYIKQATGVHEKFGDKTVSLYPAGHILGSAQILIESDLWDFRKQKRQQETLETFGLRRRTLSEQSERQ